MSEQQLRQDIDRLRNEIDKLASGDQVSRDRLNHLISGLEKRLERLDEEGDEGLADQVRDSIRHFETEHPRATAILNDIMVTLSNMGI